MEDEDVDPPDIVPPSPVATSTQLPQLTNDPRLPRLPRLPDLDADDEGGVARPDLDVLQLSPIATESQHIGQGEQGNRSPIRASGSSTFRRVRGESLQGWVVRLPDIDVVLSGQQTQRSGAFHDIDSARSSPDVEIISVTESSADDAEESDDVSEVDSDDATVVEDGGGGGDGTQGSATVETAEGSTPPSGETSRNQQPSQLSAGQNIQQLLSEDTQPHSQQEAQTQPGQSSASTQLGQGSEPVSDQRTTSEEVPNRSQPLAAPGTPVMAAPVIQRLNPHLSSPADFRSPKRRRIMSSEKPVAAENDTAANDDNEEEGECCPICFEAWTTSGGHRLSALKCGHLFGQSCIEKWLKGQGGKCPQCNAKAKRQDVRVLFAKSVKALDTTERDRALRDLEREKECRRKAEMEGAQLRLQYQMAIEETNKIQLELEKLKSQIRRQGIGNVASTSSSTSNEVKVTAVAECGGQFVLDKTIKISDAGNCRVMAYSSSLATLVVSQPSSSPLFPGFGIKKISSLDFKTSQYVTIHSKAIRDLSFHPFMEDGMLLSCGLDKKVKLTNLLSNSIVQSYETPMPAWSCVWNADDRNYFYAGLQNGLVLEFDIRNTGESVQEFNKEGSRSPVAALSYLPSNNRAQFMSGGLLIGQLDKVTFFESLPEHEHRLHMLPLEGSLTSLRAESGTRHVVASYRPAARHPTIRHELCEMVKRNISTNPTVIDNVCSCNVVHTFLGGRTQTVLSRTAVLQHPGDNNRLLICAGDETSSSVHVWDSGTGELTQKLSTGGITVDLCSFTINHTVYLSALTDKQCKVFKWT